MDYDTSKYEEIPAATPQPRLQEYLSGARKFPAIGTPEMQEVNKQLADASVDAVGASFMPEGSVGPVKKAVGWGLEKTGLSKLPDWLMQKAVGIKQTIPGVGDRLIEQGVVGPKDLMKGQVENAINITGQQIGGAVKDIPGYISHTPVANEVGSMAKKFTTPSVTPEAVEPKLGVIAKRAEDIFNRSPSSAQEALKLKQIAQGEAYNKFGDPLAGIKNKTAAVEAKAYGTALEQAQARASQFPVPNALPELNQSYGALKQAERGLNKSSGVEDLLALLGKAVPTSTLQSGAAHMLTGAGKVARQAGGRRMETQYLNAKYNKPNLPEYDQSRYEELPQVNGQKSGE